MIKRCGPEDLAEVHAIINDAATAYRGVIPADRWHEPYMSRDELERECDAGVEFFGYYDGASLAGVMGLQNVKGGDVALVRHAYTRTASQGKGIGDKLLTHVKAGANRPLLVGTWRAATWAIRFYEARGFTLVDETTKVDLLRRYWSIPDRQVEESVVLADERWLQRARVEQRPQAR